MSDEIIYFYNVKDDKYYQSRYTHEYLNNLIEENQELKRQIEDISEELELVRCDLHNRISERDSYERELNECLSQQKEFIEYLEKEKERCLTFYSSTPCMYAYDVFKDVLSKYKEIIGGKNEIRSWTIR